MIRYTKEHSRRRLFYFLLVVFLLVSPVLIAYSFGYQFNFVTGTIEQTGGVFIKSNSGGVSIFLDGAFMRETSLFSGGALLQNVIPGMHVIRLEKSEHVSWSKTITVAPSLVNEFRNIVLVQFPVSSATSSNEERQIISEKKEQNENTITLNKKGDLLQRNGTSTILLASRVYSFSKSGEVVFFVDLNGFLAKIDLTNRQIETIGRPGFFLKKDPLQFVHSPAGEIAIIDPGGGLSVVDTAQKLIPLEGGIIKTLFDERGEKLLAQKEQELKIFWRSQNERQPFQPAGSSEVILSSKEVIRDMAWFYGDGAHVVYRTKNGIFFLEIDGRENRNVIELVSEPTDEISTTPLLPEKIFYRKDKTWFTISL